MRWRWWYTGSCRPASIVVAHQVTWAVPTSEAITDAVPVTIVVVVVVAESLVIVQIAKGMHPAGQVIISLLLKPSQHDLLLVALGSRTGRRCGARPFSETDISRRRRTGLEPIRPHPYWVCPNVHGDLHVLQPIIFHGVVAEPRAFARLPLGSAYHTKLGAAAAAQETSK